MYNYKMKNRNITISALISIYALSCFRTEFLECPFKASRIAGAFYLLVEGLVSSCIYFIKIIDQIKNGMWHYERY